MKWSDFNLMWGRPLRSILALFNNKKLTFKFNHLESTDYTIAEQDLKIISKKIKDLKDYNLFLKANNIVFSHTERERIILKKNKINISI